MDHYLDSANRHLFNFYGEDEIETVAAAFSDHIESLELKGNDGSVHEYHRSVAAWNADATMQRLATSDPGALLDLLREYADDTEDVVAGIMYNGLEDGAEAPIQAMAQRYRFGYHAGSLATQVEAAIESDPVANEDAE